MMRLGLLVLILTGLGAQGQVRPGMSGDGKPGVSGEGKLIYPDSSIGKLRQLVDSLKLREMPGEGPREGSRTYYSMPQGRMWKIHFSSPTDNLSAVIQDLCSNKPLSYLVEKYR